MILILGVESYARTRTYRSQMTGLAPCLRLYGLVMGLFNVVHCRALLGSVPKPFRTYLHFLIEMTKALEHVRTATLKILTN